jgi:hypothetical protein
MGMMAMFRKLTRLFGGGIIGWVMAIVVMMFILLIIIAILASFVIYPLFFAGLFTGAAFSAEFYKYLYPLAKKRGVNVSEDAKIFFTFNIGDLMDTLSWRAGDVEQLKVDCRLKEKAATEARLRIEQGTQSLNDTWRSLVDKHTMKESLLGPRKIMSLRIKKAAMITFKDPNFAKMSEELEEETVKFESFLA